ncbi:MAG TPA: tetratricopeptide repeat protein [Terracidiphilus sp.]|nr:tetratricopeptide repeat protein [Terracidiphilus sp.]
MDSRRRTRRLGLVGALAVVFAGAALPAQQAQNAGPGSEESEYQNLVTQGFELHKRAQFADAIPVLERARRIEPRDYVVNLLLGIDLLRSGSAAAAIPRLELAAAIRATDETSEDYLGEAQASLGHYAQAAQAYQAAMERSHGSEEALEASAGFAVERFRQIGESLRASTRGVATVQRLQAAANNPSALVCTEPASALERRFALESVHAAHADAVFDTAYQLSLCYAIQAGRAAERLQSSAQDQAAYHRLRGDVLLRVKTDAAAAENEYRNAIQIRPGDPTLLTRLAEAQLAAGNTSEAKRTAQAALDIDPHSRDALRTLAFVAMSDRDYGQALPWLRELVAGSPSDVAARVELGKALAQTGANADAIEYLGPALAAGYPDEKGALHALEARVLRELGREAEAAKASAEARRLSDAFQAHNGDAGTTNDDH